MATLKTDCPETSWEVSFCHRLHFDPAYAPAKFNGLIDFSWTGIHEVDRRVTDSDHLETSWEASLCHRDHFVRAYAREILHRKKFDRWVFDFIALATDGDSRRRPLKIWPRASLIALKLLGRFPCDIGFILPQHMHMRFCIEKKLTHDSLIFDGQRSTWQTAGRPTRISLKLLGRLPCVIGIILYKMIRMKEGSLPRSFKAPNRSPSGRPRGSPSQNQLVVGQLFVYAKSQVHMLGQNEAYETRKPPKKFQGNLTCTRPNL
ncbi:uncharacterized protein G2W53_027075 [Senna tora]|uniref:Uncharacterized protein n=1 Tax=Senna tora TaxID=362788 RepID=A0A834TIM9_9FABA|nr:uncharacterized protein G2W53_027075 [Senna tora]